MRQVTALYNLASAYTVGKLATEIKTTYAYSHSFLMQKSRTNLYSVFISVVNFQTGTITPFRVVS